MQSNISYIKVLVIFLKCVNWFLTNWSLQADSLDQNFKHILHYFIFPISNFILSIQEDEAWYLN
jgi:hypothetical protein